MRKQIFGDVTPDDVTGLGGEVAGAFGGVAAASSTDVQSSSSTSSSSSSSRGFGSQSMIGSKASFHSLDKMKNVSFDA